MTASDHTANAGYKYAVSFAIERVCMCVCVVCVCVVCVCCVCVCVCT